MLRMKLTKLKQLYATAFLPKLLKETKTVKKDIDKCSIDYFSKTTHKKYKSTDSGSKDDDSSARRKAIIDQCFPEKTPILHEKDTTPELLSKEKVRLYNIEDKNKSSIFENDKIEQKVKEDELRNAEVQAVAAKVEEVKLAHDIIHTDKTLHVETDGAKVTNIGLLENTIVDSNTEESQKLTHNTVQIDRTPQSNGAKVEELGTSKVSELLQDTNIQATTGNFGDDEKIAHNIVHIDKTPHVKDINAPKEEETLQKVELQATVAKTEQEKLAHHIVHIDKTPLVDISTVEIKNSNPTLSVSEALQKDEDRDIAAELEKEKLAQHTYNIAKGNPTQRLSEQKQNTNVQATTEKIEEEKLAQKIDQIDEIPHVEAGVAKFDGFNVSPKILGHDPNPNLSIGEPKLDNFPGQPEQVNLDELAKKCLGKPDGDVDQILLKELKNISQVNSLKFNLPKDDFYQKYFSQILQEKTKDNNNIVFDISDTHLEQILRNEIKGLTDNEMKLDHFHPFHLDTVPLITTDTRDYKNEFDRKYSPDGAKNLLLEIPAVLDPYDMQAIPFYQYVTKENIILKEVQLDEAPVQNSSTDGIIGETEINAPMNEDVILKREEETENIQENALNTVVKELEEGGPEDRKVGSTNAVEPLTEVDASLKSTEAPTITESDVAKLLEYKNVLMAQQEAFENMSPNFVPREFPTVETSTQPAKPSSTMGEYPIENSTQTLLTTSTPTPTDPFGNPIQSESDQGQYKPFDETRTDTAISAHQDPDEYFPTSHLNSFMGVGIQQVEYIVTDSNLTYTGVFDTKTTCSDNTDQSTTENLMSQSISYYSTFPQLSDFSGNSKETFSKSEYHFDEKERITHILIQPKRDVKEELIQPEAKLHNIQVDIHLEPKPKLEEFREESIQQQPRREERVEASDIKNVDALSNETTPLSVLLRRVRERNRLESIRSVKMETEVAKKPPCLTPLDRSKPKTTMHPSPCQPKPKEKEKHKCPDPCKPPKKKDPCAKFVPFFLHSIVRSNLDVSIPCTTRYDQIYTYISLAKEIAFKKLKHLSHILGFFSIKYKDDEMDDIVCARDFNPWVPIPSWPVPKVEKKQPFACPKEGCKLPVHPVRSNTGKPCLGMPKKISPSRIVRESTI
ncbi:uncharacterized protein LOC123878590 [Maniola jurtina]|uniref:uncharacterized protein LOC123878590 n=1 Tax=Maniola jurtina TaxID=191418 RepID=UPI001E687A9F|nr:uncharacterized protein LOC123878590 [Maniola jurtina]